MSYADVTIVKVEVKAIERENGRQILQTVVVEPEEDEGQEMQFELLHETWTQLLNAFGAMINEDLLNRWVIVYLRNEMPVALGHHREMIALPQSNDPAP